MKRFVICEDGAEYIERFRRFLGGEFQFVRASHFQEAAAALPAAALLLDLDFRRTDKSLLLEPSSPGSASMQGLLILRRLRAEGVRVPVLLFADLDGAGDLEAQLRPLQIVPSSEGLPQIAQRLRAL